MMRLFSQRLVLFAILQKYDFSSKSQQSLSFLSSCISCLRYCKSTIFQANHNTHAQCEGSVPVVCDTAKVRFFKQITTHYGSWPTIYKLFAILQKYDFSSKSQLEEGETRDGYLLFAILQKYDFSSKSQQKCHRKSLGNSCLRYCKSTIFQANHNFVPLQCD